MLKHGKNVNLLHHSVGLFDHMVAFFSKKVPEFQLHIYAGKSVSTGGFVRIRAQFSLTCNFSNNAEKTPIFTSICELT